MADMTLTSNDQLTALEFGAGFSSPAVGCVSFGCCIGVAVLLFGPLAVSLLLYQCWCSVFWPVSVCCSVVWPVG